MTTLLTAEIRKVTTLKFWWALAIPPVLVGVCASAISSAVATTTDEIYGGEVDGIIVAGLVAALVSAMIFAAVFSAVNVGTEFRHDTITTSFLTAAGRDRVIAAKVGVTALFALGYGLVVASFSIIGLLLFTGGRFALSGDIVASVAAGLFAVMLWSLIGSGLGLLFGSPTWPSIAIVAWFPVGEMIVVAILSGLGIDGVWQLTPSTLTISVIGAGSFDDPELLPVWPWAPIGLTLWALGALAAGWYRTRERDID
ncbi:ABC transporter permease [Rhodococcus sp. I2R]|uniref:ABC transporter permease n=1 Tax=Rhodococcus sp. I2R TaxID=2855445 RepID=UPI001E2FCCFB|nr:ABC transporter permease [Rhodococcus sp. I2R]MCC8928571.1 ABC transporter permease [Rhodococcus sp. I2R]